MRRPWLTLTAAVVTAVAGVLLAFTVPAGAAVLRQSPPTPMISIDPVGRIHDFGRTVALRVHITCRGTARVVVSLSQPPRTHGVEVRTVFCTGRDQVLRMDVTAEHHGRFRPGHAFAAGTLTACADRRCTHASTTTQVHLY